MGGVDRHDRFVENCKIPVRGKRWYLKCHGYVCMTIISNCKLLFCATTLNNVDIIQRSRNRNRAGTEDTLAKNGISICRFMRAIYLKLVPCNREQLRHLYKSPKYHKKSFRAWDQLSEEEQAKSNEWEHWVPYMSRRSFRILHKPLPEMFKFGPSDYQSVQSIFYQAILKQTTASHKVRNRNELHRYGSETPRYMMPAKQRH